MTRIRNRPGRTFVGVARTLALGLAWVVGGAQAQEVAAPVDAKAGRADPVDIAWMEERSMLRQADEVARQVAGSAIQWRRPFADPQPREAVEAASVWVLGYPGSVITRPGESVLASWADPALWDAFGEIGIDLLHSGPIKRSGGVRGREYTPTIDGRFDPISLEIDPALGTEAEYRRMVAVADERGGLIAGDIVPLHTGTGPDFRLAQRAVGDYPGLYTMVAISEEDWGLLPAVADPWSSAPVPKPEAVALTDRGYIPGLINSCDASPDAKDLSGWDASGVVIGADGIARRWVFLHYFKPGQPTLNWLDPTSAAQRVIAGDVVEMVHLLGTRVVRLDAVPFLGIEPEPGLAMSRHYQHPRAVAGTDYIASMIRKFGGWSFQELNVPLDELKPFLEHGPDLSYDFFTRTEYLHALLTGDAGLLRQAFRRLLDAGIQPVSLVHDLQNHDEFTYQLVELDSLGDEQVEVDGRAVPGRLLRERVLREMRERAAGPSAPYNLLYRPQRDGVATTMAGFIAAGLGIRDPYRAAPGEVERIRRVHLLLATLNAMQPGVFCLSGWDLVGALPLPSDSVADRMRDGDYRWINRGGIDLMGASPGATTSSSGLPRALALYGSLPEQLADPGSFASGLRRMLDARERLGIALGELLAAPEVGEPSACVLLVRLPGRPRLAITALNFGREPVAFGLDLAGSPAVPAGRVAGRPAVDAITEEPAGTVDDAGRLTIELEALAGVTLVVEDAVRSPTQVD